MSQVINTGVHDPRNVADFRVGTVKQFLDYAVAERKDAFVHIKAVNGEEVLVEFGEMEKKKEKAK
jgi:hypothetical protein